MKILHVVGDSRFGGIVGIILGLGRVAQAEGWHVDVLTTDPAVQQAVREAGLGVIALDVIRREIRPGWDIRGLLRLRRFLRAECYRVVHTHTSKAGFVGRLAARLERIPVIIHTAHGFAFHEFSARPIRLFYSALERMASRWCDQIVSVSEFHKNWALELGICRLTDILAIPNGIRAPKVRDDFDAAELRRGLSIGSRDVLILTVARLAADKGLEYLIEAAALLPRQGQRYLILIAGNGPYRERLEQRIRDCRVEDSVQLLGFRSDIAELLAACDLVVQPSLREGMSITLLEAMASGKPIIATSIGSHREVAAQAEIARLVPPADPPALAEAIQQFTRNPSLAGRLAANARDLFDRRYTEDRMLDEYRSLYLDLLHRKASSPEPNNSCCRANARIPVRLPVRAARSDDLNGIVAAHQEAFANFFLTKLGPEFLRVYYKLVLTYGAGIVLVSDRPGVIDGFACGFVNPAEFYKLMWRHKWQFLGPAAYAVLRHPSLTARMLHGVRRIHMSASQPQKESCELSSIAVLPNVGAQGLGRTLMRAFIAQAWSMNADCIYLTTDAQRNERANSFYLETGFQLARCFLQPRGRWMNEYVIHRRSPAGCGVIP